MRLLSWDGYATISFVGIQLCAVQRHGAKQRSGAVLEGDRAMQKSGEYFIVKQKAVPEVLLKVVEAKKLLESGKAATIQDAVERVDISRSSFYKYKDDIFPVHDNVQGTTITLSLSIEDEPGLLSDVLKVIADFGANILTIHQSIPINGMAALSISIQVPGTIAGFSGMLDALDEKKGVRNVKILARE